MIFVGDSYYVFGGHYNDNLGPTAAIRKLDANLVWSTVGNLYSGRAGHNVLYDGTHALVIGGAGTFETQKCSFSASGVDCNRQSPTLVQYNDYADPFHFLPSDFCQA